MCVNLNTFLMRHANSQCKINKNGYKGQRDALGNNLITNF